MPDPVVSFVVPAKAEAASLPATLDSIRGQRIDREYEGIVVDGDSDDATPDVAREYDATVVEQSRTVADGVQTVADGGEDLRRAIGDARHREAGDWLAFVDADTVVRPDYRDAVLGFARRDAYFAAGGFPNVPNEDTAFSREFGRTRATGYHPAVLAKASARRIAASGSTRTLAHSLRLDWRRFRAKY